MNRRILITIEYKGSAYCGWQIQKGGVSVQQVLTECLEKICGHKINLCGSGRTDSGVHAMAQYAHFDCNYDAIPDDKFPQCANALLPADIKVLCSRRVESSFHARFDAKKKIYLYKMYYGGTASPIREGLFTYIPFELDTEKMNTACGYITGRQDFSAFCASGSSVKDFVREIYSVAVTQIQKGFYTEYYFEICGSGFLRNMVRIIAGTLIEIGRGKMQPDCMRQIISGKMRINAGYTAPPQGLYLMDVIY
ncbi:MAG: tRNA pseudouridine(38-40) synthase TruA [Clostridia bacterium]|nr:tRNA pseudouridine(38-40) synthase TruA [Clostridia bacterium]